MGSITGTEIAATQFNKYLKSTTKNVKKKTHRIILYLNIL